MNITIASVEQFDHLREVGALREEHIYQVVNTMWDGTTIVQWAWSPDGEGVYWYDTLADLEDNH